MTSHTALTMAAALAAVGLAVAGMNAFQHREMPAGTSHEEHLAQLKKAAELKRRGDAAMGFDQDKTTHRFLLEPDGGVIEVEASDPADRASRDAIRLHLAEIAKAFARGDFGKPFATHAEVPPGVPAMERLKSSIAYSFRATERGGRVTIVSSNAAAIQAIHEFLRYQIREHSTH